MAALEGLAGDVSVVLRSLSVAPSAILGRRAAIEEGAVADLAVFEPAAVVTHGPPWRSKGLNEPFDGVTLPGRGRATIVDGRIVHGPLLT